MGVNSGPIIRMADGHVAPQDIDWIKTELDKAGKEKPVIFITHYPLQPGDVDNWYDVTDAIRPYNIRLVMGGHYHKWNTMVSPVFCAGRTYEPKRKQADTPWVKSPLTLFSFTSIK